MISPEHPEAPDKKIMAREEAERFVRQNLYPIDPNNKGARCVDGRYSGKEYLPPLSMPGADPGYYLVIAAALKKLNAPFSLDKKEIWDAVVEAAGGEEKFLFHTDSHAEHDQKGTARGCGHLRLADTNPEKYGISKEDMNLVFTQLQRLEQAHPNNYAVLEGDHKESAVFVVESQSHALKPMTEDRHGEVAQGFVLQETLNNERLELLAEKLHLLTALHARFSKGQILKALKECFQEQLSRTLQALAKGLPLYHIKARGDSVQIQQEGVIA